LQIQLYSNSTGYPYIYATCFGFHLGHPQAYQLKKKP